MPVADEGIRFIVQLRNATAPTTYDFALSLPEGTSLLHGSNGSATVIGDQDAGADLPVGYFSPPFAYDADGRKVAVKQTITATNVRLALSLTGSETYAILVDPT